MKSQERADNNKMGEVDYVRRHYARRDDHHTPIELSMRIALVFAHRGELVHADDIARLFPMSRASAYRYAQRLRSAMGVVSDFELRAAA